MKYRGTDISSPKIFFIKEKTVFRSNRRLKGRDHSEMQALVKYLAFI